VNILNKRARAAEKGWVFRGHYARFLKFININFDVLRNVTDDLEFALLFRIAMDWDKDPACLCGFYTRWGIS